jgi:hypothetical protein
MSGNVIPPEHYQMHAFGLALQYLAAGRFAVASHFTPVSGNLLHHAIEMLLKGCLARVIGVPALPRGRTGHDLEELWSRFRQHHTDATLDRFDHLIEGLDRFEYIRYPENLITEGGFFSVGFPSGALNVQLSGPKLPEYQLSVEDIDALAVTLFRLGNVNPEFYSSVIRQGHASKYFAFRNSTPLLQNI